MMLLPARAEDVNLAIYDLDWSGMCQAKTISGLYPGWFIGTVICNRKPQHKDELSIQIVYTDTSFLTEQPLTVKVLNNIPANATYEFFLYQDQEFLITNEDQEVRFDFGL
jgi:hypothetical protein